MRTMLLLFSHKLTDEQILDAKQSLNIARFISLTPQLQDKFSCVPPELDSLNELAQEFLPYIKSNLQKGDYALIQGDFGLCYKLIEIVKDIGALPVYATTQRLTQSTETNGQTIKKSIFKHVRFRKY